MKNSHIQFLGIVFGLLAITSQLAFAVGQDSVGELESVKGRWEVTEVHINSSASSTPQYEFNDQRLVGRIFQFTQSAIKNNTPEGIPCDEASASVINVPLDELIAQNLAGYGDPPKYPSSTDYMLPKTADSDVKVIRVACKGHIWNAGLGTDGPIRGAWIVPIRRDKILVRWYGETILVLKMIPRDAVPTPSYRCADKMNDAESTICASFELSAFDKSVKTAYDDLVRQARRLGTPVQALVSSQRKWLRQRDLCRSDAMCIQNSMKTRLEQLASEQRR